MNTPTWFARLAVQLPGWSVWYSGSPGRGWYAVPAPAVLPAREARARPYRIGPYATPQELRIEARERYGWFEHCQSCGGPWQDCGHRAPEVPVANDGTPPCSGRRR